jgi:transposase InsO family protein
MPLEPLTGNGGQYTNWRGKTRFEHEMKKDRVKHIRSHPHHPMTLGKIERFWKTIFDEFLQRAQFGTGKPPRGWGCRARPTTSGKSVAWRRFSMG